MLLVWLNYSHIHDPVESRLPLSVFKNVLGSLHQVHTSPAVKRWATSVRKARFSRFGTDVQVRY